MASDRSPSRAASRVSSVIAACRRTSSANGAGRTARSRPRIPSPSTTHIDSTTAPGGASGTCPVFGILAGTVVAEPVTSASMTGAGSSPDGQVWSCLVPASQESTSATYPSWCLRRLAMGVSSMLKSAPHRDGSVSAQGTNSAICRSPAAGSAPHISRKVRESTWRRTKSRRENGSASDWPGWGTNASSPPASDTIPERTAKPSSPSTRSSVTTGRWLTPATVASTASAGRPSAMARSIVQFPTSWQRPTALSGVSRHTARVRQVIGLVMLSSQASGQTSTMSFATPTSTGTFRSERLIPPGPTVSPTDWRMPYRAGTSMSTSIESNPPVEIVTITKSAPARARRWSVVVDEGDSRPHRPPRAGARAPPSSRAVQGRCPRARCAHRGGTRCPTGRPGAPASTGSCRLRRW